MLRSRLERLRNPGAEKQNGPDILSVSFIKGGLAQEGILMPFNEALPVGFGPQNEYRVSEVHENRLVITRADEKGREQKIVLKQSVMDSSFDPQQFKKGDQVIFKGTSINLN